jgi:hypothetical protein
LVSADPSGREVCGRSLAESVGSNLSGMYVNVVCCLVEASAAGRSLVQRSPAECDVLVRDLETSKMRQPSSQ